jgi:hypothetical protein
MTNGQVPPPPPPPVAQEDVRSQLSGPSTGLLVTGIIGGVLSLMSLVFQLIGAGISTMMMERVPRQFLGLIQGFGVAAISVIELLVAGFIIFISFKMKEAQEWPLAIAASILAMIPCISPCCIVGLPIGIWCLVVLNKPEVKAAFR